MTIVVVIFKGAFKIEIIIKVMIKSIYHVNINLMQENKIFENIQPIDFLKKGPS